MIVEIRAPRINNNDDDVRLVRLCVAEGTDVSIGALLAEVETDKATVSVDAPQAGKVLGTSRSVGEMIHVGSVLLWIGTEPGDAMPLASAGASPAHTRTEPTAKAKDLLAKHGLREQDVPMEGERMTAKDVESFAAARIPQAHAAPRDSGFDLSAGRLEALSPQERGMLREVLWHRDEAVPAYLEYAYDDRPWREYAQAFAERNRLLMNPLLGLMAHQLASAARRNPKVNSTVSDDQRWHYSSVNLAFTVQVHEVLYLVVVRDADKLTKLQFVNALTSLQRSALAHKLGPEEVRGATVGFTSMERWGISQHIPILPAHVSLMAAHSVDSKGQALLGATYDHRVLNGGEVALTLKQLAEPNPGDEI